MILLLALGCRSEPLDACAKIGAAREPFTRKCLPRSYSPVTDPSAPDYGRVPCRLFTIYPAGSAECACTTPGHMAVSSELRELARSRYLPEQSDACESAVSANDDVCVCEFLQHEGDALAACQSRSSVETPDAAPNGWCYVEPALGLGSADDVADCPGSEKRLIHYYPDERVNLTAVVACAGNP